MNKLLLPLLAVALALAGCATPSESHSAPQPSKLLLTAADYSLAAPASVKAGLVEVTLENVGTEFHHVIFYRLTGGHTVDDLREALVATRGAAPDWAIAYGGPNVALPGAPTKAILDLEAGEYAIACIIPSSDHMMHVAKGMISALRVEPATGEKAEKPTADATVRLRDFAFDAAAPVKAGNVTLRVVNEGQHTHELVLFELFDGVSTMEFLQALEDPNATSPPPGRAVGGVTPLSPGKEAWVPVELTPGRYTFVCFDVAGTEHGGPHFLDGMVHEFTVA